jgi:Fic family protein
MGNEHSLVASKIPTEVKDIANAIAQGEVKNAKMEWRSDGTVVFSADSPDGKARIIMEKIQFAGVTEESRINVSKPTNVEERLQRVEVLHKRGMTQTEISKITMTSQKTVSNDIQKLKARGVIED